MGARGFVFVATSTTSSPNPSYSQGIPSQTIFAKTPFQREPSSRRALFDTSLALEVARSLHKKSLAQEEPSSRRVSLKKKLFYEESFSRSGLFEKISF